MLSTVRPTEAYPLRDPEGPFCRACATRMQTIGSGKIASHAPGGARVWLRSGRPHCYGANKPGWDHDFVVLDPTTPMPETLPSTLLTVVGLRDTFGLDPVAVRLMHMRDLFPLPVAVAAFDHGGNQYLYDADAVRRHLDAHRSEHLHHRRPSYATA